MQNGRALGSVMIEGLEQALAYERGELKDVRVRCVPLTARKAAVAPSPQYDAAGIRRIRERLLASQPVFASMLNVSDATVRAWERGARQPSGPTLRLLEVAEKHPEALTDRVAAAAPRGRRSAR